MLIVEDNEHAGGALRVLFEATGHRVEVAPTVAEAVAAIVGTHPDLVLLDLTLPDGDGFDVVEQVFASGCPRPPIVAVTGHDDPTLMEKCTSLGFTSVVVKPVQPRELIAQAKEWLST